MDWASSLNWIPTWLGWPLAAIGLGLMAWAIWGDLVRGRHHERRCARCAYDMSGTPGLLCPECGQNAFAESNLHRPQRNVPLAALALCLLIAGVATTGPAAYRNGWRSFLPTTAVILMLPEAGTEFGVPPLLSSGPGENRFAAEMRRRVQAGKVRDWQWRWAIKRTSALRFRRQWPEHLPLEVSVEQPSWTTAFLSISLDGEPPGRRGRNTVTLNASLDPKGPLVVTAAGLVRPPVPPIWSGQIRLPVEIVPADQPILAPASDGRIDAAALRAIDVSVWAPDWSMRFGQSQPVRITIFPTRDGALRGVAFGLVVELWEGDRLMGTTTFEPQLTRSHQPHRVIALLEGGEFLPWKGDLSPWRLRIRGDERASLFYVDCARYWAGDFTVNLADVVKR